MTSPSRTSNPRVAFVLGGGGHQGAHEVGMLKALFEHGVMPDLIVGTSVGALNGAAIASDPSLEMVDRLRGAWTQTNAEELFGGTFFMSAAKLVSRRTHLHSNTSMRRLIKQLVPAANFEDLQIAFECVAACIERAAEHWFNSGELVEAILASAAVPGLLPPVEINGEHFVDGGIVNSIPIERAVILGATEIYVLHVGRIENALKAPRTPIQVAMVAFEIARRHRFARDLATLPDGVVAHVLPTGQPKSAKSTLSELNYRDFKAVARRIDRAHKATSEFLATKGE